MRSGLFSSHIYISSIFLLIFGLSHHSFIKSSCQHFGGTIQNLDFSNLKTMKAFNTKNIYIPNYSNSKIIRWNSKSFTLKQLCNHLSFTSLKLTKLVEHRNYLTEAETGKFIPKGMLKLSPVTIGLDNKDLINNIRKNDYISAFNLMKMYKNYYPTAISETRERLFRLRHLLRFELPHYVYCNLWSNIKANHFKNMNLIKNIHRKKIERDKYFNLDFKKKFCIEMHFGDFSGQSINRETLIDSNSSTQMESEIPVNDSTRDSNEDRINDEQVKKIATDQINNGVNSVPDLHEAGACGPADLHTDDSRDLFSPILSRNSEVNRTIFNSNTSSMFLSNPMSTPDEVHSLKFSDSLRTGTLLKKLENLNESFTLSDLNSPGYKKYFSQKLNEGVGFNNDSEELNLSISNDNYPSSYKNNSNNQVSNSVTISDSILPDSLVAVLNDLDESSVVLESSNSNISNETPKNVFKNERYFPVNLSEDLMDKDLQEVCTLGKSFVITQQNLNRVDMQHCFDRWALNLRRAVYFQGKSFKSQTLSPEEEILKQLERKFTKSDFEPPKSSYNQALELYIKKVHDEIFDPKNHRKVYPNISKSKLNSISNAKKDDKHIIRFQDKGGLFTFNKTENYKDRIEKTILDPNNYEILDSDPTSDFLNKISNWATKFQNKGELSEKLVSWIIPEEACPGAIYGLDKTHKNPVGMRIITSGCGTATENLSDFVLDFLKPLATNLPNVIRDTTQFLNCIENLNKKGPFSENIKLVTVDVSNMFASIDNEKGLKLVKTFLNERGFQFPSTSCILEAIKICLECNCSSFENKFVKQFQGAPTGPSFVCDYADIAMSPHDQAITSYDPEKLLSYSRYRDDCFVLWDASYEDLNIFIDFINSIDKKIQFTFKASSIEIEFLDVLVYFKDGFLQTNIYSKPTDGHIYLHPSSSHPKHQKNSIPRSVAIRLKRIISEPEQLKKAFATYINFFIERGYKKSLVETQFKEVEGINRSDLLMSKNLDKSISPRVFPLVFEYSPKLPHVNKILKDNLNILYSDPNLKYLFPEKSIFWASKRGQNLGEKLAPSRFRDKTESNNVMGCFKGACGNTKCNLCSFLVETNQIVSFSTGEKFKIRGNLNCESKNVIYCINDIFCNLQNVGHSKNFKTRFSNYKSHIKSNNQGCNLYKHWNLEKLGDNPGHPSTAIISNSQKDFDSKLRKEMQIVLLEEVHISPSDSPQVILRKLEKKEGDWQVRLNTEHPWGLNMKDDFKHT